jgi:hypothetical protein
VTSLYCTQFFRGVLHDTSIERKKLFTCEQLLTCDVSRLAAESTAHGHKQSIRTGNPLV